MKVYEGELLEGGVSSADGRWKKYSYLKIGSQQLNNVRIDLKLDRVLHGQIDRGVVKLWVIRWMFCDIIAGITQSDGQTFRQSVGSMSAVMFVAAFIGLCSLLGAIDNSFYLIISAFSLLVFLIPLSLIRKVKSVNANHAY
ncbi:MULTISPECIES: hypothetical protein [Burkholderia]|uniref:hypothetical protein n=1 Tax=Burkholderia TaxID=32008 RepID=UPI00054CF38C|nr:MULTISPECIES: hypothetical protein [Burkholderia]TCT26550.1 hypothetical protein EC918_12213 [Burkholderia vietnamiensis]GBH24408.1 hypothetical protein BvRS1_14570 [Burkholderia vietnamiensis]SCZ46691.1 hypothetical protein SAMN02787148_13613 [Burkholderia vietnamiensis]SFY39898.1 hypothetical protein SAMN02787160_13610 [Burkholderia vietnamiensis]